MARYFFYGTLMDREVLGRVIGRRVGARELRKARLDNYRCLRVEGEVFPAVAPRRESRVSGLVMDDLTRDEVKRLVRYEGPAYRVVRRRIRMYGGAPAMASLFESAGTLPLATDSWDYAIWRRRYKKAFVADMWRWL
ncbi:MAG: gamma-glutamylcyclotransferase, partial [Alphaproteobacteria bacterium]|nr:gamma-glutamylcyclotransferase [Alphaproteobacteria bacterium]